MRTLISHEPFPGPSTEWHSRGIWPAKWIAHPSADGRGFSVVAYRLSFNLPQAQTMRVHVSADERYQLLLDGQSIGRGPERGDRRHWFYETHDLDLPAGAHALLAKVWWLGAAGPSPYAQMTVRPGFLLAAEGAHERLLSTGLAPWKCRLLGGYELLPPDMAWGAGAKLCIDGSKYDWDFETGEGPGWTEPREVGRGQAGALVNEAAPIWYLRPAMLPPMYEKDVHVGIARHVQALESYDDAKELPVRASDHLPDEAPAWDRLLAGRSALTIPPNTARRIIVDLQNYYCAYPQLTTSRGKGSRVRIRWAEGLYLPGDGGPPYKFKHKGNRDEIDGKTFIGVGDEFLPDGGSQRQFTTLWWEAGRYVEIMVATADEPLTIDRFSICETHYPYTFESRFSASDLRLEQVIPLALRTLEMCSHETYMDCPYYEQLMYVGDTRLEVLTTYATTRDDKLPRKALAIFNASRLFNNLTQSRYPSRVTQVIPPFSLWWVAMVHDYAMWRNDPEFVAKMMPGVRGVLDAFRAYMNSDGLVEAPEGWNFTDWVPTWKSGIPPEAGMGVSSIINLQTALVLAQAAELEEMLDEPELAMRNRRHAGQIAHATVANFWDDRRGMIADDLSRQHFSEHAQCLAILAHAVAGEQRDSLARNLLETGDLSRTTIYFSHYLFETYRRIHQVDLIFDRMGLWFDLAPNGLKTTIEMPEPSRSDCHAWGAHPVFHYYATILGIRPAATGFASVRIEPQLGRLAWARGSMVHPKGSITVDAKREGDRLRVEIDLPEGITGNAIVNGQTHPLSAGRQVI